MGELKKKQKAFFEQELLQMRDAFYLPGIPRSKQDLQLLGSYANRLRYRYADLDFQLTVSNVRKHPVQLARSVRKSIAQLPFCVTEFKVGWIVPESGKEYVRRMDRKDIVSRMPLSKLGDLLVNSTFTKLDTLAFFQGRLVEVTVVYKWLPALPGDRSLQKTLQEEIKEATKEKEWFKVLKRKASLTGKPCYLEALNGPLGIANEARSIADALATSKMCPNITARERAMSQDALLQRLSYLRSAGKDKFKVPTDNELNEMARKALFASCK